MLSWILSRASYDLIGAVTDKREFLTAYHIQLVEEKWRDGKKYRDDANDKKLREIVSDQGAFDKFLFPRAKHMGSWLIVWGTTVIGTVLAATQYRNFYVHVITLTPPNLQIKYYCFL